MCIAHCVEEFLLESTLAESLEVHDNVFINQLLLSCRLYESTKTQISTVYSMKVALSFNYFSIELMDTLQTNE